MKYKCLIFDHDDTTVNSTATIHHPCFQLYLDSRRPGMTCSLEEYMLKNFEPGFLEMARQDYHLSDEELDDEFRFWVDYVRDHVPEAYPGIPEIMRRQKEEGGLICVVSHSYEPNILRDYERNGLPVPDAVYGWGRPPEQRKPNPFPVRDIMERFGLEASEILMIDDLKPGYDMARAAGIDFAAAGWSNDIVPIERFMRENCERYFKTVPELAAWLQEK